MYHITLMYTSSLPRNTGELRQPKTDRVIRLCALRYVSTNKIPKVQLYFFQHLRMSLRSVHTLLPNHSISLRAAQLPGQDDVECVHFLLRPLHASTHHRLREAALEATDGVSDDAEVDERDLPNVKVEVTLEYTLSVTN